MNQNKKTTLLIAFILIATNFSLAMYDTKTGRFLQQDPLGTQPAADVKINPFGGTEKGSDTFS